MVDRLFSEPSLAALYDLFSPWERRSDFHFYLPFIMSARAVLDVGCGTGAMLHRARESGHAGRLCGLDPAPGMLEQARKRSDIECGLHPNFPPVISRVRRLFRPSWGVLFVA